MSISCLMVHWLEHLVNKQIFPKDSNLLEFGPQELTTSRPVCNSVAKRLIGEYDSNIIISKIFDNENVTDEYVPSSLNFQKDFYSIFGAISYESLDLFNESANYDFDLNYFIPIFKKYDVITNFGTAEHCFEVGRVFSTAFRLLKPGGVMLSVLPAFGDIDHGFYNIHPNFYRALADQSGFEILDLQYIDDIAFRTKINNESSTDHFFDFNKLIIKLIDMDLVEIFREKVLSNFIDNCNRRNTRNEIDKKLHVFDYTFVALRRRSNVKFKAPYQYFSSSINRFHNLKKWIQA